MTGALIILAVTVVAGIILRLTHREVTAPVDESARTDSDPSPASSGPQEICCGLHEVCEKGLSSRADLYFDDEELDRFAGRAPESYTPEEIEEFREVLYTLPQPEVALWGNALTRRDISLPLPLRDEWIMLVSS